MIHRKSITRSFFFYLVVLFAFSFGGAYLADMFLEVDVYSKPFSYYFVGGVFLLVFIGFYYNFSRPFRIVMRQVKLVLTGRPYKKILTDRNDEIGILAHFFNEVTANFEKVTSQLKEREKIHSEMEVASNIQKDVLPTQTPQIAGLDVMAKTRFADDLGGDCFGFIKKGEGHLMYIGDVTGHGLPAALVMMMVSTLLDTYAEMCEKALQVVVNTNKQLKPRIKATMFMTMLLLSWDPEQKRMSFVGAGHEYLFVYRKAVGTVEKIPAGGIALGMVPDNSALVKEVDLDLAEGDVILLFSDGITEARDDNGEMYGENRLMSSFTEHAAQFDASGILFHIAQDFSNFTGDHEQEDDMTLICIKYNGINSEASEPKQVSTNWDENNAS